MYATSPWVSTFSIRKYPDGDPDKTAQLLKINMTNQVQMSNTAQGL